MEQTGFFHYCSETDKCFPQSVEFVQISVLGLLNAESCRMGAPAFISFPHFFNADPYLLNMVNGLKPEEEKHAFYMDIIPVIVFPLLRTCIISTTQKYYTYISFDLHTAPSFLL